MTWQGLNPFAECLAAPVAVHEQTMALQHLKNCLRLGTSRMPSAQKGDSNAASCELVIKKPLLFGASAI
jgi:hypothetical protein